jgi:hypothetical protein
MLKAWIASSRTSSWHIILDAYPSEVNRKNESTYKQG